jgi:hypothetical protein
MKGYFGLGQLSSEEKSDILDQHKSVYNGYQTMQPQVSNTQPLTVYDFAGDKDGITVNNKGEVKKYTNMGINEQVSKKSMCEQCGGQVTEGLCEQCGSESEMSEEDSDWDATLMDGLEEETGHLDDIYNVEDLNSDAGFDYIEGGSNDVDTFEGMHKNLYKEGSYVIGSDGNPRDMKPGEKFSAFSPEDFEDDYDFEDEDDFEDPDNEDDGFLDDQLDEQGGNADDMDVDDVEPAYDFESNGPMAGGDVYPVNEYETMESAWADEEIDEVDVSGSQGTYSDMKPPYDFDSKGPGIAGPYQRFSFEGEEEDDEDDFGFATHNVDFDGDDSEEEEWEEIDTDLQEGFKIQKNKIMEMFNRFNKYN